MFLQEAGVVTQLIKAVRTQTPNATQSCDHGNEAPGVHGLGELSLFDPQGSLENLINPPLVF